MVGQPQPGVPVPGVPAGSGKGFTAAIRRHPVPAYYLLTFAISWGGIAAIQGVGPVPMAVAVTAGPLGPAAACVLLTWLLHGKAGLRQLGIRLRTWPAGARWYAVALLAGPVVMAATAAAVTWAFPGFYPGFATPGELAFIVLAGVVVGIAVGSLEELGWTGFALPQLRRRYGVLATGLIMGMLWGAWHYPMFAGSADPSGAVPAALVVAVYLFAWLPPYRVLMVWVYDHTRSLPLAMMMHAPLSAAAFVLSFMAASGTGSGLALLVPSLAWGAAFWAIAAVVLLVRAARPPRKGTLAGTPQAMPDGNCPM